MDLERKAKEIGGTKGKRSEQLFPFRKPVIPIGSLLLLNKILIYFFRGKLEDLNNYSGLMERNGGLCAVAPEFRRGIYYLITRITSVKARLSALFLVIIFLV